MARLPVLKRPGLTDRPAIDLSDPARNDPK